MTYLLDDISTRLRDLRRLSHQMPESQEQVLNILDGLASDVDNELSRQESDRRQGVNSDDPG